MHYPVEVDLGRKEPEMRDVAVSPSPSGKKPKTRIFYPTLYIDGVEGMPSLPKEGIALVHFRRKRMSVEENYDGKETSGVTLEIQKLCLPEEAGDDSDDMESQMAKFAKGEGVNTGRAEEDDEESDEDEE